MIGSRTLSLVQEAREHAVWRSAALLVFGLWTLEFILLLASQRIGGAWPDQAEILRQATVTVMGILVSAALGYKLIRERTRPFFHLAAITIGFAMVFAIANTLVSLFSHSLMLADAMGFRQSSDGSATNISLSLVFWFRVFLTGAGALLAVAYALDVRESEQRAAALQALAHRAQLRAFRYQVNPHFLFNALNSVSALITGAQPDRAETVVANLSDFLRASLATDPLEDIPLWREIEYERLYLEIEQVRFPHRLRIEIAQTATAREAMVPSLILQPLIENSIKHAVAVAVEPVTLRVSARTDADRLIVDVSDDGPGLVPAEQRRSSGVGLDNVRQRLLIKFPDAVEFESGRRLPRGFGVRFSIPLRIT